MAGRVPEETSPIPSLPPKPFFCLEENLANQNLKFHSFLLWDDPDRISSSVHRLGRKTALTSHLPPPFSSLFTFITVGSNLIFCSSQRHWPDPSPSRNPPKSADLLIRPYQQWRARETPSLTTTASAPVPRGTCWTARRTAATCFSPRPRSQRTPGSITTR